MKGTPKQHTPRPNSLIKWRNIQTRFKELYQVERRRMDDVEKVLCGEFFISPGRLAIILKMKIDS